MKTIQEVIKKYEKKIAACDQSISHILDSIRNARMDKEDQSIIDDLRAEKQNANKERQLYLQFIKDIEEFA